MAGESVVNGSNGVQGQQYANTDPYAAMSGAPIPPNASASEQLPATTLTGENEEKPPTKEEIGWFFVEQYYKTLCNEPGKLYLYYNKRSQFVSGDEAEKVQVAVGQKAISERIKQLDIQDCKVRVLNVDSQESLKNILVQVIGEMSNKAEPHRKFVQTFVLAEQPSGYYVLNDVFRYIVLDEEEFENGATAPDANASDAPPHNTNEVSAPATEHVVSGQAGVDELDRKLEDIHTEPSAKTNGDAVARSLPVEAEDAPVAAADETPMASEAEIKTATTEAAEEQVQPEVPQDPETTPSETPPKPSNASSVAPEPAAEASKPSAPKTWANLVAANRAAAPNPAGGATTTTTANPIASKVKPMSNKEPAAPTSTTEDPTKSQQNGNAGWQTAGSSNEKRQNRNHSQSISSSQDNILGYVKNVTEKVDASILKEKLNSLGKLVYFDVSRPKNCAFVEFESTAGFQAVVAANPHIIGGENVIVEERRPRANPYNGTYANRGNVRGGRGGNENRPNNSGRGNFKEGARGGFNNRGGRGGAAAARGRTGQAQAA